MRSCLLLLCCLLLVTPAQAQWYQREQAVMGTLIRVELWHQRPQLAQQAIDRVMAEMQRIDALMSPYRDDSLLSKINREAATTPVTITAEMFKLLQRAHQFSQQTHGAFDITYASIGRYYDYRKKQSPDDAQIRKTLEAIDYHHVILDEEQLTVRFRHPQVYIDLGGIAKGHAVDNAIAILQALGIEHAIVTAGGDSRMLGDRRGRPWVIGIRDPRRARRVKGSLPLVNTAVSTSGDYERYFIKDGEHYHHILNPDTGKSAKQLRSVTVIGPDATTTDALSTSIFVLGPDKGMALVNRLTDIEAILIGHDGVLQFSSGLMTDESHNRQPNSDTNNQ